jgi:hypothetical protein
MDFQKLMRRFNFPTTGLPVPLTFHSTVRAFFVSVDDFSVDRRGKAATARYHSTAAATKIASNNGLKAM